MEGQRYICGEMRGILMNWINEVHLQYGYSQETYHMVVLIIDRYLQVIADFNLNIYFFNFLIGS